MKMGDIKKSLKLMPCEQRDIGTTKCRLGPKFMDTIGAHVGCPIEVRKGRRTILCSAWPREDCFEGHIQIDETICKDSPSTCNDSQDSKHSVFSSDCIKVVKPKRLVTVKVVVILSDLTRVSNYRCQLKLNGHCENLTKWSKNLLLNHVVSPEQCVVDCQRLKLGNLYKISYMIIEDMSPDDPYGLVTEKTEIKVSCIKSKERFEQQRGLKASYNVLGGLERQEKLLSSLVQLPLLHPDRYAKLGLQGCKGILLHGPPGSGKTSLVRKVAHDCEAFLISINGPDIFAPRPGETEENMRNIFSKAFAMSNEGATILFIDELDSVCPRPGKMSDTQDSRVVSQLTSLMDRLGAHDGLVVIGATNNPHALDPTVRMPGRFDKEVLIGAPNIADRRKILQAHAQTMPLTDDVDFGLLAEATPGFMGADLANLCQEATYLVLRKMEAWKMTDDVARVSMIHFKEALSHITPSTQKGSDILVDNAAVTWEQIGGLEKVKAEIKQAVDWPLKHAAVFQHLGIPRPRGVLLHGPPGCSKTTLVKAAASACNVTFLSVSAAQLYSPFVGDSERALSNAFHQARMGAPAILFIDEIDSIVGKRSNSTNQSGVGNRLLSTLLNEMDGIGIKLDEKKKESKKLELEGAGSGQVCYVTTPDKIDVNNNDVMIIGATNRPDMLDDALLRPGRLDRIIYVPPPDQQNYFQNHTKAEDFAKENRWPPDQARLEIIRIHSKKIPLDQVDLDALAEKTEYFTGADLENLCKEAALRALTEDGLHAERVTQKHFMDTLSTMKPSLSKHSLAQYSQLTLRS